jgi:hypothetical protein
MDPPRLPLPAIEAGPSALQSSAYPATTPSSDELSRDIPILGRISTRSHKRQASTAIQPEVRKARLVPGDHPDSNDIPQFVDAPDIQEDIPEANELEDSDMEDDTEEDTTALLHILLRQMSDMQHTFTTEIRGLKDTITHQSRVISSLNTMVKSLQKDVKTNKAAQAKQPASNPTPAKTTTNPPTAPAAAKVTKGNTPTTSKQPVNETVGTQPASTPNKKPTYAEVSKKGEGVFEEVTYSKKKKDRPLGTSMFKDSERRIILKRDEDKPAIHNQAKLVEIRDACNSILREFEEFKSYTGNIIISVRSSTRGHLIAMTAINIKAETVMKHDLRFRHRLAQRDFGILDLQEDKPWHKVVVHSVDCQAFPDTDEGMKRLAAEITMNNEWCKFNAKSTIRYLKPLAVRNKEAEERMTEKTHTSVVITVADKATADAVVKYGLIIWGTLSKSSIFRSIRPFQTCTKCLGFGHHSQNCKSEARCNICAEKHHTSLHVCQACSSAPEANCGCIKPLCYHCRGEHMANSPSCPTTIERKATYLKKAENSPQDA